ncbi:MAG: hydroxyacylglutathione hydrolase [Pseudomonadota bacterium]
MAELECHQFPCRSDNFGVLIHHPETGATASIDVPEAEAVRRALAATGWTLSDIFITHYHTDHTEGVLAIKGETGARVTGPRGEASKIDGLDGTVGHGDHLTLGNQTAEVFETPGHTLGHIVLLFRDQRIAFTGDTLFSLGCGRVFEGTHDQMFQSMSLLMDWPDDTVIHCGHEYTKANAAFALSVDPDNTALTHRAREVETLRAANKPTLPTTIGAEKATNPFLRFADPAIRARLNMAGADDAAVFSALRTAKDRF